jgi:hypothetical protein
MKTDVAFIFIRGLFREVQEKQIMEMIKAT